MCILCATRSSSTPTYWCQKCQTCQKLSTYILVTCSCLLSAIVGRTSITSRSCERLSLLCGWDFLVCSPLKRYTVIFATPCIFVYCFVVVQLLFFKMETLSEQQRELIRKMSDDRLKQSLLEAGLPLAAINVLDWNCGTCT